jgi:hypothetical protein
MEAWLEAHGLEATEQTRWPVPPAEDAKEISTETAAGLEAPSVEADERRDRAEARRARLRTLVDGLPTRDLETAVVFIEFLRDRRQALRARREANAAASSDAEPNE